MQANELYLPSAAAAFTATDHYDHYGLVYQFGLGRMVVCVPRHTD